MTTSPNARIEPRLALCHSAAEAALAVLPTSQSLTVGEPGPVEPATLPSGQAVLAAFSGSATGAVAVLVGQDLADALLQSPLGELDLAQVVRPALEAAAGAFGTVVLEDGELGPPADALAQLQRRGAPVQVELLADDEAKAAVVAVLDAWPQEGGVLAGPAHDSDGGDFGLEIVDGPRSIDLLHDVEMEVSAELGRTRMSVRELLSLTPSSVVELDRAAGSPADLLVNGRLIARGEVVVIDENFGIRITEIVATTGPGRGTS